MASKHTPSFIQEVFATHSLLFAQDRHPIEFVKILYRGDRYRYTVRLSR